MATPNERKRPREDGESVFVSMTDLSVSFLFIVLVLLAFFATQFKPDAAVPLNEYEMLAAEVERLETAVARLEREIALLRDERDAALAERDAARERAEELAAEIERLEAAVAELERETALLRDERDAALAERDAAHERAEELATEVERLEATLARLEREIASLRDERDAALAERDAAHERAVELAAEVERLEATVAELEREIARLQARVAELEKPDPLAAYLEGVSSTRASLLERLAARIRRQLPGLRVTVVAADGIIRFRGDDLFASGQWRIRPDSTADRVARAVGDALADALPCYTMGAPSAFKESCNGAFAAIETIQIEGHTDDVPISEALRDRERMRDNRDLSARRGAETLRAATDRYRPELMAFLNLRGQPVLSFAGYGAMRPIARGATADAHAANRRIDIRFILQTPQNLREVEEIRERLTRNRPHLPTVVDEGAP